MCDGGIVSGGFTGPPGTTHAEAAAIAALPAALARSELAAFVTLEPCAFVGRTPACAETLIHSGIAVVYVSIIDPDPRNNGAGIRRLMDAGIHVEVGLLSAEIRAFLSPYLWSANVDITG